MSNNQTIDPIKLSSIASTIHGEWLLMADRSYSPFNKPWEDLSAGAQAHIGGQAFRTLTIASELYPEIVWEDDLGAGAVTASTVVPELEEAKDEVEVVE